jgi:hypothetical protein
VKTRAGVQPQPQLQYANPGNGTSSTSGSNQVAPATTFAAAGVLQPFVIVPPNWQ